MPASPFHLVKSLPRCAEKRLAPRATFWASDDRVRRFWRWCAGERGSDEARGRHRRIHSSSKTNPGASALARRGRRLATAITRRCPARRWPRSFSRRSQARTPTTGWIRSHRRASSSTRGTFRSRSRLKLESVTPTCSIDVRAFRDRKEAAFKRHATQQGSAQAFYGAALVDVEQLAFAAGVPQPRAVDCRCFRRPLAVSRARTLSMRSASVRSDCVMPPASCVESDIRIFV